MAVGRLRFWLAVHTSGHHYAVFMRGATPLTSRLFTPALIDAETAVLTDMRAMPWYVTALFVSRPLHFGDYGGRSAAASISGSPAARPPSKRASRSFPRPNERRRA